MKILEKIIEHGLYLFVFLLPWQTRLLLRGGDLNGYWEYGTISIYATEILLWIIFILAAVWWAVNKFKNPKSKIKKSNEIQNPKSKSAYLLICLFAFLLYSLVSILWSDSRSLALYVWHWLAEAAGLFLVLRAVKFDLVKLAWVFVVSAVIQAGLGTWQFLSQSTFSSKWLGMALHDPQVSGTFVVETALRRWLRAYGSLPHPNIFAGFLSVAMFLSVWLYQKIGYGFKKLFLPAVFAILSFGLCATFSKSVIASFLLVLISLWAVYFIRGKSGSVKIDLLKFTLIFFAVAIIFFAVFWEPVQTRIIGAERLELKSTTERLSYFGEAWQLIKNHPVLGVGLGNYTLAIHNEINPALQAWNYQPVHNIYLLILAELGIVGLILWLALMFALIKNLPVIRYPLLIMLLLIGLFDHYLWTFYFGVIFLWFTLGLSSKNAAEISLDRSENM